MAIFRPRIVMSYLEQTISGLQRIVEQFPTNTRPELRMYKRMRDQLRTKYRIECCDITNRSPRP